MSSSDKRRRPRNKTRRRQVGSRYECMPALPSQKAVGNVPWESRKSVQLSGAQCGRGARAAAKQYIDKWRDFGMVTLTRNICKSWRLFRRCSQTRFLGSDWALLRNQARFSVYLANGQRKVTEGL